MLAAFIIREAASTSEPSVDFYQTTRRYNPEGILIISVLLYFLKRENRVIHEME
jgi:hypothetical protein